MNAPPFRYAALGDSTAAGYGVSAGASYAERALGLLRRREPHATLTNLGRNGAVLRDVLSRQVPSLTSLRPGLVTVSVGANDLWRRGAPDEFAAGLDALGRALAALPAVAVVSNLPDLTRAPIAPMAETWLGLSLDAIARRLELFNGAFRTAAARHGFTLFDLFGATREALVEHPEYFGPDGFHPSDEGHAAWAHGLWPVVEAALDARPR